MVGSWLAWEGSATCYPRMCHKKRIRDAFPEPGGMYVGFKAGDVEEEQLSELERAWRDFLHL